MFATTEEISQYVRLSLKEHGLTNISFSFKDLPRSLGYFHLEGNEIVFSFKALKNFVLFSEVCKHEICHALDARERGGFKTNGKNDFHGKNWKKYCRQLKIPARRFIPA